MVPPFLSRSSSFSDLPDSHTEPPTSTSTSFSTRFFSKRASRDALPASVAEAKIVPFDLDTRPGQSSDESRTARALGPAAGRGVLARQSSHQVEGTALDCEGRIRSGYGFGAREPGPNPSTSRTSTLPIVAGSTHASSTRPSPSLSPTSKRKPVPNLDARELEDTPAPVAVTVSTPAPESDRGPVTLRRDPILNGSSRRVPPISGLNSTFRAPLETGRGSGGAPGGRRNRSTSTESTGSVSKDAVLRDLGDAIRKERARREMFEAETAKAKAEMLEIEGNLAIMTEKFNGLEEQQELTIRNLEAEIEELEEELATVDNLDDTVAQEYLTLLSSESFSHLLGSSHSPVDGFDPSLLRSTCHDVTPTPTEPDVGRSNTLLTALKLKRGRNLKRRIDSHVAARAGSSLVATRPSTSCPGEEVGDVAMTRSAMDGQKPRRKLSRSRRSTAPSPVPTHPPPPPRPVFPHQITTTASHLEGSDASSVPSPRDRPRQLAPTSGSILVATGSPGLDLDSRKRDEKGSETNQRRRRTSFRRGLQGTMKVSWANREMVVSLISLRDLASSKELSLNPSQSFQGYIFSDSTFDLDTESCTLNLVSPRPHRAVAVVRVSGPAGPLINNKVRNGDKVCLCCEGATVTTRTSGLARASDAELPWVSISYACSVSGYVQRKGQRDEHFSFGSTSGPSLETNPSVADSQVSSNDSSLDRFVADMPLPPCTITSSHTMAPVSIAPVSRAKRPAADSKVEDPSLRPSKRVSTSKHETNSSGFLTALDLIHHDSPVLSPSHSPRSAETNPAASTSANPCVNFVVMIVKIGNVTGPRSDRYVKDPHCARFRVVDQSLLDLAAAGGSRTAQEKSTELQWYEFDLARIPRFEESDILVVQSIHVTDHAVKSERKIRRYARGPLCPYLTLSSSSLLGDDVPLPESLAFHHTNPTRTISRRDLDAAVELAKAFHAANPTPITSK
ncbi:hypothetical protein JCM11491_003174 [Sporobolomyces phaffii]